MRPRFKDKYRVESIRLQNRDYAASGWYFVTICTYEKSCFFGNVIRDQMQLSAIGEIAEKFWLEIPKHSKDTSLDTYVIMPNHVHGIMVIDRSECRDVACNVSTFRTDDSAGYDFYGEMSAMSPRAGSLSAILRSYKAAVSR